MKGYLLKSFLLLVLSMSSLSCEGPHGIPATNKAACPRPGPAGREELSVHPVDGIVEIY
jgi:hypothetical protein